MQDSVIKNWIVLLLDRVSLAVNTTASILYDSGTAFDDLRFGVARNLDSIAALRLPSSSRNQSAVVLGYYENSYGMGLIAFISSAPRALVVMLRLRSRQQSTQALRT